MANAPNYGPRAADLAFVNSDFTDKEVDYCLFSIISSRRASRRLRFGNALSPRP